MFVDTNPKKDVLKPPAAIQDDDPDVFCKNLIQRYQHRPMELSNMCLAEFAAKYNTDYKIVDDDTGETDMCSHLLPVVLKIHPVKRWLWQNE